MDSQKIDNSPVKWLSRHLAALVSRVVMAVAELLHRTPLGRVVSVDVLRYAICGVTNYIIIDALLYYAIYHYLIGVDTYIYIGIGTISPHVASLAVVFPITFITGFWLNRHVAFNSTEMKVKRQMVRYGFTIVGSILLSYTLLKIFVEVLGVWATPAKVLSSLLTAIYSYLIARLYTFRRQG
ncbi:MAG: GtrA family protein [Rikenellaceae bacterium]